MQTVNRRTFIKMLGVGTAMLTMPSAIVRAAANSAADGAPLAAKVGVNPEIKPAQMLNRRLFGKFAEHLGKNVYGGAWAQLLSNPDFVPIDTWPDKAQVVNQLTTFSKSHNMPILDIVATKGVLPPWWVQRGNLGVQVGGTTERPTIVLAAAEGVGSLVTPVYLPAHRTQQYIAHVRVRGAGQLKISLQQSATGAQLAAASVSVEAGADAWATRQVSLQLPAALPIGTPCELALALEGVGSVEIRQSLLFPADHLDGWDPEVVRFMREAKLPLLRFPGGNFVSGYHWEDAIGPLERRPVKKNTAWPIVEWNHVGTDEWLRLCELVGCEPLICVNAGNGTPEEAARWVEYCNGAESTPMGALRAQNGHPAPYNVRMWEVGNELYGSWQTGHTDSFGYGFRYKAFAEKMLAVDSTIQLIANGNTADWNRTVVYINQGQIRSFSHHALTGDWPANADPERVYLEHMANTEAYARQWVELTQPIKDKGLPPHLAITEMQVFTQNNRLPTNATLTEALWTASIINAAIRSDGLVELISHSALVNHGGGLRKDLEVVWAQPVWWVTHLYGTLPEKLYRLDLQTEAPTFTVQPYKMRTVPNASYLDAVGLSSADGSTLVFFLVNRHPRQSLAVQLALPNRPFADVEKVTLTGATYMATNTRNNPNAVRPVFERTAWSASAAQEPLVLPPISLVRLTLA